eukprot:630553-Prymnesium_polylepis.1
MEGWLSASHDVLNSRFTCAGTQKRRSRRHSRRMTPTCGDPLALAASAQATGMQSPNADAWP